LIWADRKRLPPESEKVPFELEHEEERMKNLDLDFGLWRVTSKFNAARTIDTGKQKKEEKIAFLKIQQIQIINEYIDIESCHSEKK